MDFKKASSFTYKGKEYQVDKVVEQEPEAGNRCLLVITTDNCRFKITFNGSLYRWVITESTD